ncbi:MAG TPA: hypothetical protein VFM18_11520, partial [Methanosarcina sp.]|nr:hypothetical protein [Methanosarcina sp.]
MEKTETNTKPVIWASSVGMLHTLLSQKKYNVVAGYDVEGYAKYASCERHEVVTATAEFLAQADFHIFVTTNLKEYKFTVEDNLYTCLDMLN